MRKSLQERDKRSASIAHKRAHRKALSRDKKTLRRHGFASDGHVLPVSIKLPATLSIQNKKMRRALCSALNQIKKIVGRKSVYLDFSDVVLLYPSAVLLLTAELDRQRRNKKSAFSVRMIAPRNEIAEQVLHQVGIAELCSAEPIDERDHFDESVRHWRYATGERMNDAPGRALERFEGQLSDELQSGMWKGVSEAIVNSVHHAYLEPRGDGFEGDDETRWWMFSQVRDEQLTVAVCDLGIGIPRSLPLIWEHSRLQTLLAKFGLLKADLAAIRAALEIGATRTREENRGRGLPQIWEDMKGHEGANILLLSNRALLHWSSETGKETEHQYDDSIFGTMVIWSVPLRPKKDG
jgi:hypothetical protein